MKVGKTWNSYRIPGLVDVENSSPRAPYIKMRNLGEYTAHKAQRGNSKRNKFRSISKGTLNRQVRTRFMKAPLNAHSVYRSDPRHPIKVLMTAHLAYRNARSVPWAGEEAPTPTGGQDSTCHDIGPRASKSFSLPKEPDSRILRGYCGAKGFGDPGLFHIGPMAHAEEEEMFEDEQRESILLGYTAEDNLVLNRPKSRKGKAPHCQRQSSWASQRKFRAQWAMP